MGVAGQQWEMQAGCRVHAEIRGIPPLRAFATILDKRHVLTQDSEGQVSLWDVTCAARVQDYGKVRDWNGGKEGQMSSILLLLC